jgi:hypothetical protein
MTYKIKYTDHRDLVDTPKGTGRLAFHNRKITTVEIDGKKIQFNSSELTNRRPA